MLLLQQFSAASFAFSAASFHNFKCRLVFTLPAFSRTIPIFLIGRVTGFFALQ